MTVIFSLFIFTSLLMFTVGIVVGKSVANPKSDKNAEIAANETEDSEKEESSTSNKTPKGHSKTVAHSEGTSVSTDHPSPSAEHENEAAEIPKTESHEAKKEAQSHLDKVTAQVSEAETSEHALPHKKEHSKGRERAETKEELAENTPSAPQLELIPEKTRTGDVRATLADLADNHEVNKALKNPKVQALLEGTPKTKPTPRKRVVASVPAPAIPAVPKTPCLLVSQDDICINKTARF
jgi:hypothetical protein